MADGASKQEQFFSYKFNQCGLKCLKLEINLMVTNFAPKLYHDTWLGVDLCDIYDHHLESQSKKYIYQIS